ncbi:MAG: DNA-directed DNA polymerase I [Promethearchaeota archaeon]|nr:MAG: DNA-directed DNA polymerase I [Candidatus Lokiarchaeota archaeon]
MPNQKKKKSNEKQKSLFSYVDKSASQVAEQQDNVKDDSKTASTSEKKEDSPEEISQNGSIKKVYMGEKELNFGFKEKSIKLESLKKEAVSSRYIRYLIAAREIVNDLKMGLLLDVDYDGGQNKAYCKFYDLESDEIKIWIDTTNHEPYCLSKETIESLKKIDKLRNYSGFKRFETVKRTDLLIDKEIPLTKVYGNTPSDIGGSGNNIKNILAENEIKAWEADIRYHLNYIFDTEIIPGLIYKIENGKLHKISFEEKDEEKRNLSSQIKNLFKDESKEIQEFSEKFSDIFLTPIPDVKRMAMDIEVELGVNEFKVPNPREAKQRVISVSFVASDGLKEVYILEREGFEFTKLHEKFPPGAKLFFFKNEKDLLIETFRKIWEYPILLTFNGDNFDLNYLFHRANKLKVSKKLNPIRVKRGFGIMSSAECDLVKGIHVDLFNFFFNRSISGYAFGGAYTSNSLNAISSALLGKEKYQHEEEIHDMEYDILSWYNLKDSILTLDLTRFNNSLVWNLIILLCRITKMPIHETVRRQISTWIQNIFYFEHRRRHFLIPRRSEISELKEGGYSKSVIEGKSFQGAYVVPPVPGIHFDVVVMDFASLYPSIIKEYNLSYETVSCPHKDCFDNLVKGIPYHVCTHKMGIFAYVVGYFRDIRVKFFKPLSGDKSLTQKQRAYYTTIQQALKVFINGSYGVFGSKNFPLFCLPVAESTTGIGQYSIKQTIKKADSLGVKVLYGDTDSIFLLNPSKENMQNITEWSKKELDLDLEEEKTYQFLALSDRKKNYIGIYEDTQAVDIKGLVAKKKNTPEFIKKVFNDMIQILKNIHNQEQFTKARDNIIKIVRSNFKKIGKPNTFTLDDYAINISIQKNLNKYDKVLPQHVRAARDWIEYKVNEARAQGADETVINSIKNTYSKGDSIEFIKSKGSSGAKVIEMANLQDIDTKKYKELLQSALEQVLDALGITFEEIKGIKKLDSFF